MDAKRVKVNGEALDVIMRHYYRIPVLIREIKKLGGSFEEWDRLRAEDPTNTLTRSDVMLEIENLIL